MLFVHIVRYNSSNLSEASGKDLKKRICKFAVERGHSQRIS